MANDGVNIQPESTPEGAKTEQSPSSAETQNQNPSPASGANTSSENVPFHKNPEFQSYIERQKKSWERDYSSKFGSEIQKLKAEHEARYKDLESKLSRPSGNLSDADREQLRALFNMGLQDPEVRKMYGLDEVRELKEKLSKYEKGNEVSAFNAELSEVSKTYAEKYGMDPKEVEYDLMEFIKDDPLWGQLGISKGVVKKAAKDFFSDKQEELAVRAANMKLVKEAETKGKASSQKPVNGASQENPLPKHLRDFLHSRFRDEAEKEGIKI